MNGMRLAASACAIALLAGCGQSATTSIESGADPGSSATPIKAEEIDSLLLPDADLESIGISYERQPSETKLPGWSGMDDPSNPCQQSEWVEALQPWAAFRMVQSRGPSNFGITQTLAVYPNPQAAQATFKKYTALATACKAHASGETYTTTSPTEVAWSLPTRNEVGENTGNLAAWTIRVVDNLVIDVSSARRRDGVATVAKIADKIVAKATLT